MPRCIHRETFFKVPDQEGVQKLLEAYRVLEKNQNRNGKPYILNLRAEQVLDDPRSKGYTVMAKMTFRDREDMQYFDGWCEAHETLKKTAMEVTTERPLVIGFKGEEMADIPPAERAEEGSAKTRTNSTDSITGP
ncbi:hypothetical protein N657DRAFT_689229 [Parathielavia appendiculata]|uniref:Stress-response A/B barrel domain-containing protein n=1 Tax=Parathielavia appendiculata TaxID=2587402 RepID=A0AAN6Z5E8_9PEZI|nr:hypothetical protein N657DRAFT_689229 [Parathielavia appendiculata]